MPSKTPTQADQVATIFGMAVRLAKVYEVDAILVWAGGSEDWDHLKRLVGNITLLVASDEASHVKGAVSAGLDVVVLEKDSQPMTDKLRQALLKSISDDILSAGAGVVAVYRAFDRKEIDSVSFIELDEYLGRLTARDLRSLKTRVPLETIKRVVDLAVAIGREGREGKPVGTMFVVGDTRNVMGLSALAGFDPMKGYTRKERSLSDVRVREGIKEICQLDGAIIVSSDGTVESACRLIESTGANTLALSKGLGSRHLAAASITKTTSSIAVTVSQSSGSVRLFQNGRVMLHVEPFRRAMKLRTLESRTGPDGKGD
jgi:diadenylate cyclase